MTRAQPWILGISHSHNGAACLLQGREIIVAVQEERLTRRKRKRNHGSQPSLAIQYCLDFAGIKPKQLDLVVNSTQGYLTHPLEDVTLNPMLQTSLNQIPVLTLSHHAAHATSAFALSGFEDAAVLVVDGVGSPEEDLSEDEHSVIQKKVSNGWEIISLYHAAGGRLEPVEKHLVENGAWLENIFTQMPRFGSLGGMFSAVSWQIFGSIMEAGKVMGLGPYGRPTTPVEDFFSIEDGTFCFKEDIPARYRKAPHWPERQEEFQHLAASTQRALEEALQYLLERLAEKAPSENLGYAGGVALNSVANEKIIARGSLFKDFYIIPSAEDNGPAIGAAFHGLWQLEGFSPRPRIHHDSFGRTYSAEEMQKAIDKTPSVVVLESDQVIERTVDLLCEGKIVGWFQGRSELGARALGCRSILCDPRHPEAKAILNSKVKHREAFRPFAPAILLEEVPQWFDMPNQHLDSPFMLRVCPFKEEKRALVPGVVHVDGTGRLQTVEAESNPRYCELIQAFHRRTGVPILINTSYNVMGEPIVETPEDALWALLYTGLDVCVLGDQIVGKGDFGSILDLYPTVIARSYSFHYVTARSGDGFSATDRSDMFLLFDVDTPWGTAQQISSSNVLPVLEKIDGKRSGREILQALAERPSDQRTAQEAQPSFASMLRHWQSVATPQAVDPLELAETLYFQRLETYDEKTLIRIFGQLRRAGIVTFKAEARQRPSFDRLRKLREKRELSLG